MKNFRLWLILTAAVTILCACGQNGSPNSGASDSGSSSGPQQEAATPSPDPGYSPAIIVEDDSVPPREGMMRSRLTNEWVDADLSGRRPIAVIIPNESSAVPHYNISQASIVYEANVEGRMSRMMAVYEDWRDLEKIGNIRSLRTYYAYWAFEWDAFLVHYGGPFFINSLLEDPRTQTIDGNSGTDTAAFFRASDRPAPHNGYATGAGISTVINQKNYPLYYRGLTDQNHFVFTSKSVPNTLSQYSDSARSATFIDMSGCYPLTRCYFEFHEDDGLYYRCQYPAGGTDGPHVDAATGQQLAFKNILVQNIKYRDLGAGYLEMQCIDNTQDGWFFTNGRGIHVTWEKSGDYAATKFYDDRRNEITLNTGKTMICVICDGDSFTFR